MLILNAEKRDPSVKAKKAREEGKLPAVYYGRKEQATSITVPGIDFMKVWKEAGESTVITVQNASKNVNALIHEVQLDPVKGDPIHVDFYAIEADKEVEVNVELVFEGVAPAVKELGGTLVKVLHEVEVRGLPKDLPHEIKVDITRLTTLESQIAVKDLVCPEGIMFLNDPDEIVAAIAAQQEEEEAAQEFDASQVAVEEKGKKEDPEEEGAEKA